MVNPGDTLKKTRDLRDWRVMKDRATLDLYNLSPNKLNATIVVHGVAAGSAKTIETGMRTEHLFGAKQLAQKRIDVSDLEPGHTELSYCPIPAGKNGRCPCLLRKWKFSNRDYFCIDL